VRWTHVELAVTPPVWALGLKAWGPWATWAACIV